jgi:hypothetical protein
MPPPAGVRGLAAWQASSSVAPGSVWTSLHSAKQAQALQPEALACSLGSPGDSQRLRRALPRAWEASSSVSASKLCRCLARAPLGTSRAPEFHGPRAWLGPGLRAWLGWPLAAWLPRGADLGTKPRRAGAGERGRVVPSDRCVRSREKKRSPRPGAPGAVTRCRCLGAGAGRGASARTTAAVRRSTTSTRARRQLARSAAPAACSSSTARPSPGRAALAAGSCGGPGGPFSRPRWPWRASVGLPRGPRAHPSRRTHHGQAHSIRVERHLLRERLLTRAPRRDGCGAGLSGRPCGG